LTRRRSLEGPLRGAWTDDETFPDYSTDASSVSVVKLAGYCDGDNYIQHHPQMADGLSGLGEAFKAWAHAGISSKYDRIYHVLGEGDFVLVVRRPLQRPARLISFYDS